MRVVLSIQKSLEENASSYFEASKKAKKKIEGARKALAIFKEKKEQAEDQRRTNNEQQQTTCKARKREWYEKFHWFFSSDGFLVIGGRDATTNEIVIKKHVEKGDLILHTDIQGSPFMVIKSEGKEIPESTIVEAVDFTACMSRAWGLKMGGVQVGIAHPDQVTKEAKAGEFVGKGAFMINGKIERRLGKMLFAVGMLEGKVMGGPISAVEKQCSDVIEIVQGDEKPSDVAKKIRHVLGGELDEIIRVLPAGNLALKKQRTFTKTI